MLLLKHTGNALDALRLSEGKGEGGRERKITWAPLSTQREGVQTAKGFH